MAKYVCDFETVKKAGEDLCAAAEEMSEYINTFCTNISDNLKDWTGGSGKGALESSINSQVAAANDRANYLNALGTYIKCVAEKIEELEESLSSLSI